jgi:hypothetical protein
MLIDATNIAPGPLLSVLSTLGVMYVEKRGETFEAEGVESVTATVVIFRVQNNLYYVERADIIKIIPKE